MKRYKYFITLVSFLLIFSCKEAVKLDESKLDLAYFVGRYHSNFNGKEEIFLKEDGFYDYSRENDTIILNAGRWKLGKHNHKYIRLLNFPNLGNYSLFDRTTHPDRIEMSFDVYASVPGSLGNLWAYVCPVGRDESYYIFEKIDKSKNKNYLR